MTLPVEFILPLAVVISAAATLATAAFAYQLWKATSVHERALFGDEELGHPGLLHMVRRNSRIIEREHRLEDFEYDHRVDDAE